MSLKVLVMHKQLSGYLAQECIRVQCQKHHNKLQMAWYYLVELTLEQWLVVLKECRMLLHTFYPKQT